MKLAIWLLNRSGVLERNESLAGDLLEERAAGRSALWLLGQTLAAIGDTVARDWAEHWVLALRAVATGWAASYLIGQGLDRVPLLFAPFHVFELVYTLVPAVVGWMVARTHRACQSTAVLAFAGSVVLSAPWTCVTCVGSGASDFDPKFLLACHGVLGALIGGLLARPAKRISLQTPVH